jgi:hypothetical protein
MILTLRRIKGHQQVPDKQMPIPIEDVASVRRLESLFKAMSTDFLLREQFVTDPAQILFEYLRGARLTPEKAAINNQLLYSVMSNPHLLRWIRGYVSRHRAAEAFRPSPNKDFARAVVQHGAYPVVLAMMRSSIAEQAFVNIDKVFETILRSSLFADSDADTNIDPTTPGTHIDPTTPGTNIDPTTPGNQANFFGPYYFAVTLEVLARYSTQLLESGSLDDFAAESKVPQHVADQQ